MQTLHDVHLQFADFFGNPAIRPYACLLSRRLQQGHICLDLDNLNWEAEELPEHWLSMMDDADKLPNHPLVCTDADGYQPFVMHQNRLYLHRYFCYETRIIRRIEAFLEQESALLPQRLEQIEALRPLVHTLFNTQAAATNAAPDWQLAAVINGLLQQFSIITGGPGTGKTTTVARLLALLYSQQPNLKVALAAPTGKAAARMAESLKRATLPVDDAISQRFQSLIPTTIHRLLGVIKGSPYFRHNADNPITADVLIVDESSMIDLALLAKLMDATSPATRLILLGDKDQLASVEAGSILGDLCQAQTSLNRFSAERLSLINGFIPEESRHIPGPAALPDHPLFEHITGLQISHRFDASQGIGLLSKAIIQSDAETIRQLYAAGPTDALIPDTDYDDSLTNRFIEGFRAYIESVDIAIALKRLNDCRILCAQREGPQGVYAMNRKAERLLQQTGLLQTGTEFYENRPIILTRNYYEHGLFNGDTGILRKDEQGVLKAWFELPDGSLKAVLPGYLQDAETAFALTIHKSQGSEFNEVLVVLPDHAESLLLTRELVYTAITRARQKVILQGSLDLVLAASAARVQRASGIAQRFQNPS
jgi:exodeoxyribonuclease V alpha subunit